MIKQVLNKIKVQDIMAKRKHSFSFKTLKKKGLVMLAKDLVGKEKCELLVVNPDLKAFGEGYNTTDGHRFPKNILLNAARSFDDTRVHVSYWTDRGNYSVYVPNDFKFELCDTGLMKKFEDYTLKELYYNLGHSFTIGSDPEMFIEDDKGKVIPAFHFLGSKEKSNTTYAKENANGNTNGGTKMYWDGFQAEFETKATTCLGWHSDSVFCGIKGLYDAAKKHNPNAKLSIRTTMDIDMELLRISAEEHVQFGCMPSFNAYDMKGMELNGREVPFRSAGGHIHYGLGTLTHKQAKPIVKALDAILGVACVSLFALYDDPRRRRMYGLAGEYRLPPHGLEYRVLSNAWMCHPAIMNLVFDVSRKIVVFGQKGLLKHWKHDEAQTIEIINTCNIEQARATLERNKDLFQSIIAGAYGKDSNMTHHAYRAFFTGVENIIDTPTDIEKNWLVRPVDKWTHHCNGTGKNWARASEILSLGGKVG